MEGGGGSIVCPSCGRLADREESKCPHCGRVQPNLFGAGNHLNGLLDQIDWTHALSFTCLVLYLAALAMDVGHAVDNFFAPGLEALLGLGATGDGPFRFSNGTIYDPGWATLFSANLLHANLLHIGFNWMWIRSLGPMVEEELGGARFVILFLAGGAVGFLASNIFSGVPTLGASASIFALLGAQIVIGRHHGGSMGEAVSREAWMYALVLFAFGFMMPNVNNWAHGGGFVGGYVLSWLFMRRRMVAGDAIDQLIAMAVLLLTGAGVAWAFVRVGLRIAIG